jgi:hypothetical protein
LKILGLKRARLVIFAEFPPKIALRPLAEAADETLIKNVDCFQQVPVLHWRGDEVAAIFSFLDIADNSSLFLSKATETPELSL